MRERTRKKDTGVTDEKKGEKRRKKKIKRPKKNGKKPKEMKKKPNKREKLDQRNHTNHVCFFGSKRLCCV
jgi:hypothetical protein